MPMHNWVCELSPNFRHNAQGYLWKDDKGRIVWDGSTTYTSMDVVMNEVTPTKNEAEITFIMVKAFFIG
jgi:hypothetical protein